MLGRRHERWLAENLLRGIADERLIADLEREGITRIDAEAAIDALVDSPLFDAARPIVADARRFQQLVRRNDRLARDAANPSAVVRRSDITCEEFFDVFYATGTPVVLPGFASRWPAVRQWTPEWLAARFGDLEVEVAIAHDDELDVDTQRYRRKTSIRFAEFLARLDRPAPENDLYLVAGNHALDGCLADLIGDLAPPSAIIGRLAGRASLFIGPARTFTRYHQDSSNALTCQITGRKRWHLIAPTDPALLESVPGACSRLSPEDPMLARAVQKHVVLEPGDALFVPVGTFHHVEAESPSIAVSLTGFPRDNDHRYFCEHD